MSNEHLFYKYFLNICLLCPNLNYIIKEKAREQEEEQGRENRSADESPNRSPDQSADRRSPDQTAVVRSPDRSADDDTNDEPQGTDFSLFYGIPCPWLV